MFILRNKFKKRSHLNEKKKPTQTKLCMTMVINLILFSLNALCIWLTADCNVYLTNWTIHGEHLILTRNDRTTIFLLHLRPWGKITTWHSNRFTGNDAPLLHKKAKKCQLTPSKTCPVYNPATSDTFRYMYLLESVCICRANQ